MEAKNKPTFTPEELVRQKVLMGEMRDYFDRGENACINSSMVLEVAEAFKLPVTNQAMEFLIQQKPAIMIDAKGISRWRSNQKLAEFIVNAGNFTYGLRQFMLEQSGQVEGENHG